MCKTGTSPIAIAALLLGSVAATGASFDECFQAISADIRSNSAIPAGAMLFWSSSFFSIPTSDLAQIASVADRSTGDDASSHMTITGTYDYILRYRHLPPENSLGKLFGGTEKFDTYLQKRTQCQSPATNRLRYCNIYDAYSKYRDKWLRAVKAFSETGSLHAGVTKARNEWENRGFRKTATVALAWIRFRDELRPELVWGKLEEKFLEFGGDEYRKFAAIPSPVMDPSLPIGGPEGAVWYTISLPAVSGVGNGEASEKVSYTVIRIRRPWLDTEVLWRVRWNWDRSAPLGRAFILSDGTSCDSGKALACVAEWLIVVRDDDAPAICVKSSLSRGGSHVVGLVGEILPQLPSASEYSSIVVSGTEEIGRSYSDVGLLQRLDDGSF